MSTHIQSGAIAAALGVTPQQSIILAAVLMGDAPVPSEKLLFALYGPPDREPEWGYGSLKVQMHHLRRRLANLAAPAGLISEKRVGTYCTPELSAWVCARVTSFFRVASSGPVDALSATGPGA